MTWKIPVKAAIAVGKNSLSPVDDDDDRRRANASAAATTSGLGRKRMKGLHTKTRLAKKQLKPARNVST